MVAGIPAVILRAARPPSVSAIDTGFWSCARCGASTWVNQLFSFWISASFLLAGAAASAASSLPPSFTAATFEPSRPVIFLKSRKPLSSVAFTRAYARGCR